MHALKRLGGIGLLQLSFLVLPIKTGKADTNTASPGKDRLVLGMLPILSPERLAKRFEPWSIICPMPSGSRS